MTRDINLIVVHCSATPPSMRIGVAEIRKWHLDRGWSDVGYHHVIRRSGDHELGRPEQEQGAHVKGHNEHSIGICLVGGVDAENRPEFNFTQPQMMWLADLLNKLLQKYPGAEIRGHRDLDPHKACPCFNVRAWWGYPETDAA